MEHLEVIGREKTNKNKQNHDSLFNRHIFLKYKTTMNYQRMNPLSKFYSFIAYFPGIILFKKSPIYVKGSSIRSQWS